MDCIYEGGRALYIHPDECVDCGACDPFAQSRRSTTRTICPTSCGRIRRTMRRFSAKRCQVATSRWGHRGGAAKVGALGVDAPLVASLPQRDRQHG